VQTLAIFAACIAAFALPASSDAAHGVPAKARTLTAELVPWYYTTDTETVTVTSNGLTAYSLVRSHSCSFGPGGSGKVSFKVIEGDIAVRGDDSQAIDSRSSRADHRRLRRPDVHDWYVRAVLRRMRRCWRFVRNFHDDQYGMDESQRFAVADLCFPGRSQLGHSAR
jgi:hypothetical protein